MKRTSTSLIILVFLFLFTLSGFTQLNNKTIQESPIHDGSTEVIQLFSPSLEGNLQGNPSTQPVKIYLPPGYKNFPDNRYPVVYLLHCGDFFDYNSFYAYYNLLNIVNQLISDKTIKPMIIVTPNAVSEYGNSCYTNSYVTGNWEDYIVQDVIGYVDGNYQVLVQPDSRGLSGFSIGGHGTARIAMHHPSLFDAIGFIGPGAVNFEDEWLNTPVWRDGIIAAAGMDKFDRNAGGTIPLVFAHAVAFAPDSSNKPILGRFPYTADGVFIDSIWQRYLQHDPLTMLQFYADSLRKINDIQFYVGDQDTWVAYGIEPFLRALQDRGIEYGYQEYSGAHNAEPVLDDLLIFFSESLISDVPTVRSSEYSLIVGDTLVLEADMKGRLYIVPDTVSPAIDSIIKYLSITADVLANEEKEIHLSDFEPGTYHVYVVTDENMVSNIPAEFSVISTSIQEYGTSDIKIFPNPATKILNIETGISTPYIVEITSLNGQLMLSKEMEGTTHQIDLSSFQKGVYLLTIRSKDFVTTRKIIKL